MNQKAYVVVLEDRHVDDVVSIHLTRGSADTRVAMHMADGTRYYPGMKWIPGTPAQPTQLVFYASMGDDGPSVRIEEREIEP